MKNDRRGDIPDGSRFTRGRRRESVPQEELHDLYLIARRAYDAGYTVIAGLDEAGRGPLAGVVCAAAVVFRPETTIDAVKDSKKLTEKKREYLFDVIREKALAVGVGVADPAEIDTVNILQATKLACQRALKQIADAGVSPDLLLLDALRLPDVTVPQRVLVKGDTRCFSVAAASIIAKVTRDRLMLQCAKEWPQYGFEKHKGYPTKAHYKAIALHGASTLHRRSFLHGPDLFDETRGGGDKMLVWSRTAAALKAGGSVPDDLRARLEAFPCVFPQMEREYLSTVVKGR